MLRPLEDLLVLLSSMVPCEVHLHAPLLKPLPGILVMSAVTHLISDTAHYQLKAIRTASRYEPGIQHPSEQPCGEHKTIT